MRIQSRVHGWRCEQTDDGKTTWVSNKGRVSSHTKRNHPRARCNNAECGVCRDSPNARDKTSMGDDDYA